MSYFPYSNFFTNAPVCAVAHSSWIFCVPVVTTGTLHMRSQYRVPRDQFKANAVQSAFYEPQPPEELYDTHIGPHEINNLIEKALAEFDISSKALVKGAYSNRLFKFLKAGGTVTQRPPSGFLNQ